jgi:hypothetical protein
VSERVFKNGEIRQKSGDTSLQCCIMVKTIENYLEGYT